MGYKWKAVEDTTCGDCNQLKSDVSTWGKSKGYCHACYSKLTLKSKLRECKRCGRMKKHSAKGLCQGCYSSVFQIEKIKMDNIKRYHNIDPNLYKKVIEECVICGFDKIVEMHHLDHNKTNNSEDNLVGLCPNHHKLIHTKKYQKGIFGILKEKGFKTPLGGYKTDGFFKK